MNINNHLNETNVAISLLVSITNHLKLVRIYLRNPVGLVDYTVLNLISIAFRNPVLELKGSLPSISRKVGGPKDTLAPHLKKWGGH